MKVPAQRGEPVLEIRGLCVDYGIGGDATHAVVDANLVLRRGEVLGLAGESGSGKSTLAYAATRLLREPGVITGGEVLFHSQGSTADLLDLDEPELQRVRWSEISVVMQSALNALNPVISIGAQIEDVLRAHRPDLHRGGAGEARDRAAGDGRHHRRPAAQLPARAVRRHAAARDDRDGPGAGAAGRDHGRADHRAGRGDAAGDPRGTDPAARRARLRRPVHHARPVAADRAGRRDRGHVRRAAGRAGPVRGTVPGAPASLHPRAAELVPADARGTDRDDRHSRHAARPARGPARVRVPPALPARAGALPGGRPATGPAEPGALPDERREGGRGAEPGLDEWRRGTRGRVLAA